MTNSRFNDPEELRRKIRQINHDDCDGNLFLEVLLAGLRLNNAAELARRLPVSPAVLTRMRTGRSVSDEMLLKLHLTFDLSISALKDLVCACSRTNVPITMQRIDALADGGMFAQQVRPDRTTFTALPVER